MAIDDMIEIEEPELKRTTFGSGLLKGLGITLRHLLSRSVTVQYPSEKDPLPPRSRGVIALKEENCTVCMLCARECPDWCIYIEGHKESRQPAVEGKRAKKYNVLDRFAIDYALCMYCGICVEVCPYDALFWSPEYEYAEHDITNLTHEMERLSDWMYTVLPPLPLDEGARGPEFKSLAAPAPAASAAGAAAPAGAASLTSAPDVSSGLGDGNELPLSGTAREGGSVSQPPPTAAAAASVAPAQQAEVVEGVSPEAVHDAVLADELAKGSDPRVAEARAKAAAMRAGSAAAGVGGADSSGPTDSSAAEAGPTASAGGDSGPAAEPAGTVAESPAAAPAAQGVSAEEAAEVRRKVLEEELAKGSDPRVAEGRAKAAEMRARKGTTGPS